MRLLQRQPDGVFSLRDFAHKEVPAYAILSHTWHEDNSQEVEFQDIGHADSGKAGWRKLEFCADRAAADGLTWFWVDTCCIDKRNAVEYSAAINSMFRWYQNAARCYVYLSDVSTAIEQQQDRHSSSAWKLAFRKSRWNRRGWTLQEMLAPQSVEFFSLEGERLGSKHSLSETLAEISGVAEVAICGGDLSGFSVAERMSWNERRTTTVPEDKAYSLLGIFGIAMPLVFGEGEESAFRRLRDEIHKRYKGLDSERFAVGLDILSIPEAAELVGRDGQLAEMYNLLKDTRARSSIVLHGLGGIGKTQLAIAFLRRHKDKYTAIFWLNANDEMSLKSSFREVARQILEQDPSASAQCNMKLDGDSDDTVKAVKVWLDKPGNTRWLLVYDNYDNPKLPGSDASSVDLRQFLPRSDQGSVIITTRSAQVSLGRRIPIQKLSNLADSLAILSNTSCRKDIEDDEGALELARRLDGLPLALSTAGAYLKHVTTSFSEYLEVYSASWLELQQSSPQLSSYEDRSLYTTWQITLDRIQQQNTISAKLLKLWAYFDKQDIWFELLQAGNTELLPWLPEIVGSKVSFDRAIRVLREFGLVDAEAPFSPPAGSDGYSVHSCVHSWTIHELNKDWDEDSARFALGCITSLSFAETRIMRPSDRRLINHASHQWNWLSSQEVNDYELSNRRYSLGRFYVREYQLVKSEEMFIASLEGYKTILGPKHKYTLDAEHDLGLTFALQGRLIEAEGCYTRVLEGRKEVLGPRHIDTLYAFKHLGDVYRYVGKLQKSEEMLQSAHSGMEAVLGINHAATLGTLHELGRLYRSQGRLAEAEELCKRAIQGNIEVLGPQHPTTLTMQYSLGVLYASQSKTDEALTILKRVMEEQEAIHGLSPSLLCTVLFLGGVYRIQKDFDKAAVLLNRALEGFTHYCGPQALATSSAMRDLATLHADMGKLDEAEELYIRALHGFNETLGAESASTSLSALDTARSLGYLYAWTDRFPMAEEVFARVMAGYKAVYGSASDKCAQIERTLESMREIDRRWQRI